MKLKKIVSLALAGILAVSMLTACGTKADNDNNANNVTVGGATGVSAKIQDKLDEKDTIKLSDNATYTGYLSAAIKKADLDAVALNTLNNNSTGWVTSGTVYEEMDDAMDNNVVDYTANYFAAPTATTAAESKVYMGVYAVNGDVSEEVALQKVADAINTQTKDKVVTTIADSKGTYYSHAYTGSVSVEKVTDGSVSTWIFVAVLADTATKA